MIDVGDKIPDHPITLARGGAARLSDYAGRLNVLLVFHPFAFTPVCEEEALDLQENLESFRNAQTEVVLVSCDSPPARRAWKEQLQLDYTVASDFWPHGAAAQAYGVFDESIGAPYRGTFLIDKDGVIQHMVINNLPLGRNVDEMLRMVDALQFTEEHGEVCPAGWNKGDEGMKPDAAGVAKYLSKHAESL